MAVPFIDLKAQYQSIRGEVHAAMDKVLENAAFILGPAVADFEKKFATYAGARHAIGLNSGTSALQLALMAAGIGRGDEVICPAMTFVATAWAVDAVGARPVFADVHPQTYTLDPARIEAVITPRTKAIMPVHLYGQPADMDPILELAKKHKVLVIEDAAQSHGATYKGRPCGSIGDMAGFSFYPGKNLGAFGEGGAVTTNRDDFAETIRMLRDWGQKVRYHHDLKGGNFRMEGIQGAVLGVKMAHIEKWTEGRRQAAAWYREELQGAAGIGLPVEAPYARHVNHVYAVMVQNRQDVQARMKQAGIDTGIHYPIPVPLQKCFAELGYRKGDFPVAERIGDQELSLPMFPELTRAQVAEVAGALRAAVRA